MSTGSSRGPTPSYARATASSWSGVPRTSPIWPTPPAWPKPRRSLWHPRWSKAPPRPTDLEGALGMKRRFRDLSAGEVLALAISLEEEDGRILQEFARILRPNFPKAAAGVGAMRGEGGSHPHRPGGLVRGEVGGENSPLPAPGRKGF